jgi:hypothetical protein
MFENLPPLHRPTHDADTPRRRALNALGTVLGTLPPPWRMLRDASPSGEGAGLGVRFVAIHPNLGIALVDLAPARPKAALAPLRSLLTRGNGTIFTGREPPIATVLLARDEIPLAAARVEATLAELPPSGIANPAWPEIAIALVTASYPHMMPTDGGRRAIAASGYGSQPNAAQRTPEAPAEAPPPRQETARSAAASTQGRPAQHPKHRRRRQRVSVPARRRSTSRASRCRNSIRAAPTMRRSRFRLLPSKLPLRWARRKCRAPMRHRRARASSRARRRQSRRRSRPSSRMRGRRPGASGPRRRAIRGRAGRIRNQLLSCRKSRFRSPT